MSAKHNTPTRFGSVAKFFHWSVALTIIALIPLGIIADGMAYDTSELLARKAFLFQIHKTLGVFVFFLALARIFWALTQPKPVSLHPERKLESFVAELIHWLLYGSLVLVPLTGWIHHAATTGFAPIFWPFGQDLPFVEKSEFTAHLFGALHKTFERVLGLVPLTFRSLNSFMRPFAQKPRDFSRQAMSGDGAGYRTR
ncbi:cytochrome b/b6 domain-containing protein [Halocynthiibacter namhaensis]|uniref:cytochrome b/b6 domain-containing protein n=1 Tax=Halocynthiibacter namhaensis TaxID=1290553 RepID=UPI000689A742